VARPAEFQGFEGPQQRVNIQGLLIAAVRISSAGFQTTTPFGGAKRSFRAAIALKLASSVAKSDH